MSALTGSVLAPLTIAASLLAFPLPVVPRARSDRDRLLASLAVSSNAFRGPDTGRFPVRPEPDMPHTAAAGAAKKGSAAGRLVGSPVAMWIVSGTAGLATAAMLGGIPGAVIGVAVALVGVRLLGKLESTGARRLRAQRRADLPGALSLLAAALSAGLPVPAALSAVADAAGGPLAPDLARVAQLSALGAGPAAAWAEYAADPALGRVARAAARSAESGAALAAGLDQLASDLRAEEQLRAETAARRAGVVAMAPLGVCFLPAFICLGIVPVVLGMARQFVL
jgi:Flp pilus assembly protein TadB